jgi:RNA-directed DNA polymerase
MKPRLSPANFGNVPSSLVPALAVDGEVTQWAKEVSWAIPTMSGKAANYSLETKKIEALIIKALQLRKLDYYKNIPLAQSGRAHKRPISAPGDEIRRIQSEILAFLPVHLQHPCSFAYEPGKSAIQCARQHIGMTWGIKLDLVDFFHQVRTSNVRELFVYLGASEFSANLYATILTRLPVGQPEFGKLGRNGILPQGAPTSGAISNLMCKQLDEELVQIALKHDLTYTRYSDDLFFSSRSKDFSKPKALRILKELRICINRFALNINSKKTRIYTPHSSHQLLGVLIGEDGVRLTKRYARSIKSSARALSTFGLSALEEEYACSNTVLHAHRAKSRGHSPTFLKRYVGQLSYVSQLDPKWAKDLARELYAVILADPKTWYRQYDEDSKKEIISALNALTKL